MKRILVFVTVLVGLPAVALAQSDGVYLSSQPRPLRISVGAVFQRYWDGDQHIGEFAAPVSVFVPFQRNMGMTLLATPAVADARDRELLAGMTDVQAAFSYFLEFGSNSLVLSLTANVPSGKRELTPEEYATSEILSRHVYAFRVPVFGQGFNVAPGFTFAAPVNDQFTVGVGASYQYKGAYMPLADMDDSYKPGDEILITGGFDVRLNPLWALSGDATYTLYAADRLGDEDVYNSGDQVVTTLQVLGNIGFNEVRTYVRYRTKARSTLPLAAGEADAPKTVPQYVQLAGSLRMRLREGIHATLLAQGRYFDATDDFGARTLFDLGAFQEFTVSPTTALTTRFIYTFGDFPGFDAGLGVIVRIP